MVRVIARTRAIERWAAAGLGAVAFTLVWLSGPSAAMPTSFQLVFDGHHVVATFPSPTGLSHVGTFTTNYQACASGTAENTAENAQGVATRLFTCDGSGATFTALVWPQLSEHGGSGSWQITSGTGSLADLRGQGEFSSVLVSGDPNDFASIDFRASWTGAVDLDATPPTVTLAKAMLTKLKRSIPTYKLTLGLGLTDNGGGPVSYTLTLVDPATLNTFVRKEGSTSAASVGGTFVLKVGTRTRALRLQVDASDQVGNRTTFKHALALRK